MAADNRTFLKYFTIILACALVLPFNYASAQSEEDSVIEEIMVTARKKEESLQDVPHCRQCLCGRFPGTVSH